MSTLFSPSSLINLNSLFFFFLFFWDLGVSPVFDCVWFSSMIFLFFFWILKTLISAGILGCCFLTCPSREEADKVVNGFHNKKTLPGVSLFLLSFLPFLELETVLLISDTWMWCFSVIDLCCTFFKPVDISRLLFSSFYLPRSALYLISVPVILELVISEFCLFLLIVVIYT